MLINYDHQRKNFTGFMMTKEDYLDSKTKSPSLVQHVTSKSWLVSDILNPGPADVKWMLFAFKEWIIDPDFPNFKTFVMSCSGN